MHNFLALKFQATELMQLILAALVQLYSFAQLTIVERCGHLIDQLFRRNVQIECFFGMFLCIFGALGFSGLAFLCIFGFFSFRAF